MSNPIMQKLNLNAQANPQPQMNNPMQMIQQFAEFKRQMQGKNPRAIVEDLLKSGKMSSEQFDNLKQQAQMLQNLLR